MQEREAVWKRIRVWSPLVASRTDVQHGAGPRYQRQDRRAERHVESVRRPRRAGSVAAAKLAVAGFRQGQPEREGGACSAATTRTSQTSAPTSRATSGSTSDKRRHDHRRAESRSVALAVSQVAANKNKVFVASGAAASRSHRDRSATPTPSTGPTIPGCSRTAPARRW